MTAEAAAQNGRVGGPVGGASPLAAARVIARVRTWLGRNLFSSPVNTLLTVLVVAFLWLTLPPIFEWMIFGATLSGASKAACTGDGACWTFIRLRLPLFLWGHYPIEELWRVGLALLALVGFGAPVLREHTRHRGRYVLALLTVFPVLAGVLLVGGVPGLPYVDTSQWGGLMLDVIVSFVTVAGALPLGILLALGRRSQLRVIKTLSIGFIELWRGVPLLTVLFMSAVMVPLFLPHGVSVDRLIRAMVAFTLFNAAYMAETVRGGLQGVPEGQEEAAYSLGLSWWQVQTFVTLPQALRHVVPGIVNNVVDLFKDTSLVTIIGLVDLLGATNQALKDPAWLGLAKEGYVFTAVLFFACCFAMSSYGRSVERRLNRHRQKASAQ
ncbi:MAG: ral L-amino acid transport system permease protein [Hyphomicrobiales bacterium]|jgi:general L-amino acid transport system permease protein